MNKHDPSFDPFLAGIRLGNGETHVDYDPILYNRLRELLDGYSLWPDYQLTALIGAIEDFERIDEAITILKEHVEDKNKPREKPEWAK